MAQIYYFQFQTISYWVNERHDYTSIFSSRGIHLRTPTLIYMFSRAAVKEKNPLDHPG